MEIIRKKKRTGISNWPVPVQFTCVALIWLVVSTMKANKMNLQEI
jgi:hypothetical protein